MVALVCVAIYTGALAGDALLTGTDYGLEGDNEEEGDGEGEGEEGDAMETGEDAAPRFVAHVDVPSKEVCEREFVGRCLVAKACMFQLYSVHHSDTATLFCHHFRC